MSTLGHLGQSLAGQLAARSSGAVAGFTIAFAGAPWWAAAPCAVVISAIWAGRDIVVTKLNTDRDVEVEEVRAKDRRDRRRQKRRNGRRG